MPSRKIWTDDPRGISSSVHVLQDNIHDIGDPTHRIKTIYAVNVNTGSGGIETASAYHLLDGSDKNYSLSVYASGTAYNLTAVSSSLDFGTTDPNLILNKGGTYLIFGRVNLEYNGATFAANRIVTLKLRRTNNTAADIANSVSTLGTNIVTTSTGVLAVVNLPPVIYQTSSSGASITDSLSIFGDVSVIPTAGNLQAVEASIIAIRLY